MDEVSKLYEWIAKFGNKPDAILLYVVPVVAFVVLLSVIMRFARKIKPDIDKLEEDIESSTTKPESAEDALSESTEVSLPAEIAPVTVPLEVQEIKSTNKKVWLAKLQSGLSKSRSQISENISKLLTGKAKLDDQILEDLHEILFKADVGVKTADDLLEHIQSSLSAGDAHQPETVKNALKQRMLTILEEAHRPEIQPEKGPKVILIVGVNGVGKTTSIGKLAANYLANGKSVLLCAADTFRAAAIDQLKVWGDRLEVEVVAHKQGSDPASVAFDGIKAAVSREVDILLIDTAGRLHNKSELMDELGKIKRVIKKDLPDAPHETWIVVDSTTGQNANQQVRAFKDVVDVTGLVVTKLDGTAKGGVIIGISNSFNLPIRYIGVGEKPADLRKFNPPDFVEYLL